MRGEYELAVQRGQWAAFAHLAVAVEPSASDSAVEVVGSGRSMSSEWDAAAIEGVMDAIGRKGGTFRARISIVAWNPVDTTAAAVRAAAFLAAADALGMSGRFSLSTEDGIRVVEET